MRITKLAIISLLLSGCVTNQPPAPQVDTNELKAKLSAALDRATAAEKARDELEKSRYAKDSAEKERAGKTKAVLDETNIDLGSSLVDLAILNVKLALTWYEQVQANPDLKVWLANQRAAHESGRADEVAKNYDAAMADGKALSARIGVLTEQVEHAKAAEVKARTEAFTSNEALAREIERHTKELEDAKRIERDRIAAETKAAQVRIANYAGGACGVAVLACIAGAVFLPVAAKLFLRGAALAGALCIVCFAFARFAACQLFLPVAGGSCVLAIAGWIAWEIHGSIKNRESDKAAQDATLASTTAIDVLDDYYDRLASPEAVADMKEKLFPALQAKGPAYDAAVKRIKAAQCDKKADK